MGLGSPLEVLSPFLWTLLCSVMKLEQTTKVLNIRVLTMFYGAVCILVVPKGQLFWPILLELCSRVEVLH